MLITIAFILRGFTQEMSLETLADFLEALPHDFEPLQTDRAPQLLFLPGCIILIFTIILLVSLNR